MPIFGKRVGLVELTGQQGAAPPSYEAAVGTSMRDDIGEAGLANDEPRASLPRASATTHCRSAPTGSDNKQDPQDKVVMRSTGSSASSGSRSSSNSDSESHSESGNTIHKNQESVRHTPSLGTDV
jgi:hypothetical protein